MSNIVAVDLETYYNLKIKYTLKVMIAEQYCKHQLFDPYLVSIYDGETLYVGDPKAYDWSLLEGKTLISHNAYFDRSVYAEMVRREWIPQIKWVSWGCTANMTSYLCNRRSLAAASEHLLKVKLDKDPRDKANGKRWADFSEADKQAMITYAGEDAKRCHELWTKFSGKWPEHERQISELHIRQGMRGVQIDVPLLNQYIIQTHEVKQATEKLLPWLDAEWDEDDEFNEKPTSTKCIAEQCRRVGIPAPPVKSHDEDAYEAWEAQYAPSHSWITALSSWRSVNKLLKTFETMKVRLRDDGTMPFGQKYVGSHTGRVAGESKVNLFNQRKQAVLVEKANGLMALKQEDIDAAHGAKSETGTWPEWVKHAIDFRNLIIARPGKKLIASDLSQIEPRVTAWFAKDTEFLNLVAKGISPYQAHAIVTMGWTGGNLKKENPTLYALAKARLLSLAYGAGWEKLIVMAKAVAGLDLTKDDPEWIEIKDALGEVVKKTPGYGQGAKKVVADYRASNQKITDLWSALEDAFRRSLAEDFVMVLPSGRRLTYENIRAETRIEPDAETGKPRRRTVFTACIGGKRVITYGSKLVENLVQATAREIFYYHTLKLEAAGLTSLFGVYDEAVLEVDLDITPEQVEKIMSETPPWMPGLPVAAEVREISCYQK